MTEKQIYDYIYSNLSRYRGYGSTNHGKDSLPLIEREFGNIRSLIDIGCGFNEFIHNFLLKYPNDHFKFIGVDISCPGADVLADTRNLPFEDKLFDVVSAFDVLEHIEESSIDSVLKELRRVSHRFIFSICSNPAKTKVPGIDNIHLTIWSQKTWIERISKYADNIGYDGHYIFGVWSDASDAQDNSIALSQAIAINTNVSLNKRSSAICYLLYRSIDHNRCDYFDKIPLTTNFVDSVPDRRWRYSIYNAWTLYLINLGVLPLAYDLMKHVSNDMLNINDIRCHECINLLKIIAAMKLYEISASIPPHSGTVEECYKFTVNIFKSDSNIFEFKDVDFWGYWYILNRLYINLQSRDIAVIRSGIESIKGHLGRCSVYTNMLFKLLN